MSTFVEMQQRIADDIDRSDLTAQIKKAITRAIKFYDSRRFYFQETTASFSTIANQIAYGTADGIPSNIREIDSLQFVISSTNKYPLIKKAFQFIQRLDFGSFASDCNFWAWYQSKIYLYPIPNAVRTVNVFYRKSYTELSADADTNDWTTEAEDLIEARARWWLYLRIIKSRADADDAKTEELEALSALVAKTEALVSASTLTATRF
jgi:hypothetical protein